MQIILLEKVANLGNLGDIVTVKDGYARNFLIPNRKARRATKDAIAEFQVRRTVLEQVAAEKLAASQTVGAQLAGQSFEITQKSGVDGRLFGAVTSGDIAELLKKAGYDIEKARVRLPEGPLKRSGAHGVQVALHTDVVVDVTINVTGDHA
ncbi:MAG: 50S ribosomal protein L9 [Burkholderia sp.]|nr:MAG: 50S ribosomal protein L9 [Burkholderia gladioli]